MDRRQLTSARWLVALLLSCWASCAHRQPVPSGIAEPVALLPEKPVEPVVVKPVTPVSPEQINTDQPLVVDLVPDRLKMSFLQKKIETTDGSIPVWSWSSDGLRALFQKEIALTIRAEKVELLPSRMEWVAGYFEAMFSSAERGRLVEAGMLSSFGPDGAFGRAELHGAVYVDSEGSGELTIPEGILSALLLTADEFAVASDLGPSRVLSLWAMADHHFPYPFWSDIAHASRVTPMQIAPSVLNHMRRAMLPECSVVLEEKKRLVLRVPKGLQGKLQRLDEIPLDQPLALLTGFDAEADGALVWVPDSKEINVISSGPDEMKKLTGAFLGFTVNTNQLEAGPVEDGFVVMLTPDSWKAVRQALKEGKPLVIKLGEGFPEFALEWVD